MCGIVHVKRFDGKSAVKMAERRYRDQKERGTEGFGFVALNKGIVTKYLRSANEKPILDAMGQAIADEVLFHHRNPTSTINCWECAHPIKVSLPSLTYDYYVAHNGVIHNSDELKKEHDKEGIKYTSLLRQYWLSEADNVRSGVTKWNDSESLAIELAKSLDKSATSGIANVKGSIAFLVIKVEKTTGKSVALFWGRNYMSPLQYSKSDEFLVITSTGKGTEVKPHTLYSLEYETGEYKEQSYLVGTAAYQTGYGNGYGGYNSYAGRHGYDREDDYHTGIGKERETIDPIGFSKGAQTTLPLIGASATDQAKYDLEQWMDDQEDLDRTMVSLSKEKNPIMLEYLDAEKKELEAKIDAFNKKYPNLASKTA